MESDDIETWDLKVKTTLSTFLRLPEDNIQLDFYFFQSYQKYSKQTWEALKKDPVEAAVMEPVFHEHVREIVEVISQEVLDGRPCYRRALRATLGSRGLFKSHSEDSLNRTIDLALRLWLVLNIRDENYCLGVQSIQWDDQKSLQTFVAEQFPMPKLAKALSDNMFNFALPENFTMAKLKRYSGIKVDWTFDLSRHLDLDRDHRILKIFPLKYYVNMLRRSNVEITPNAVVDEYTKTMNLLFPSWDTETHKFLGKEDQTFGMEAPIEYPGPVHLSDFHFWRDRLATLYTEFCSPSPSMTQLFYDRRNVLQWYTFWFAVVILVLTVIFGLISSITACLSTKYTYESLLLAREAASSPQSCPTVTCVSHYVTMKA